MGSLAQIIISFLNLLEVEGKTLRLALVRLALALALAGVICALLVAGFGLVIWAIYLYLRLNLSPAPAALLDGLITLLLAGIAAWITKKLAR